MPANDDKPKHPPSAPRIDQPDDPSIRARRVAERPDDGEAFLPDFTKPGVHVPQTDGDQFGEEFLASATTGEPLHMEALDEVSDEEEGGPFLELEGENEGEPDIPEAKGEEVEPPRPQRPVRRSLPR